MDKKNIIIVVLIGLVLLLAISSFRKKTTEMNTVYETDTITNVIRDTLRQYYPKEIKTITRDTIIVYTPKKDTIRLFNQQKYYSEKDKYDAWVSGYNPQLDSINVYNKTEYKTITNTITKEIYPKKMSLHLETGVVMLDKKAMPTIGLRLMPSSNFGFGANVGYYDNNITYGISINYKLK